MALNGPVLRSSFELVVGRDPEFTLRFYRIFFTRYPQVVPLFGKNSQAAQAKMLAEALSAVLDHLDDAPWLVSTLKGMGVKHEGYGVTRSMYPWVGECLLAAMAEVAGDDWSAEIEGAWVEAYGAICELMWAGYEAEA
jgi:hemoglobin-like flavoprotein